jgi:hypothetical protein
VSFLPAINNRLFGEIDENTEQGLITGASDTSNILSLSLHR